MATITIEAGALGARVRADKVGVPKAVNRAIFSALHRGRAHIIGKTPVDRGILRNAWRVIKLSTGGAELVNDQPYAGIMERGARPFKISPAGLDALTAWVLRKMKEGKIISTKATTRTVKMRGFNRARAQVEGRSTTYQKRIYTGKEVQKEARQIAYRIAKNFERVGMKGKRFVWKELPKLAQLMEDEINRSLQNFFNRQGK